MMAMDETIDTYTACVVVYILLPLYFRFTLSLSPSLSFQGFSSCGANTTLDNNRHIFIRIILCVNEK